MYISSSSSSSSFPDPGPLLAMGTNRRSPLPSVICRDIYSKILTYTRYVCKCRRSVCIPHSIKMFVRLSLKANNYFFRVYPCYKRYRLYTTTCCRLRAVGLALPHGANGSSSVEITKRLFNESLSVISIALLLYWSFGLAPQPNGTAMAWRKVTIMMMLFCYDIMWQDKAIWYNWTFNTKYVHLGGRECVLKVTKTCWSICNKCDV